MTTLTLQNFMKLMKMRARSPEISKQKVKKFEEIEETTGLLKKEYDDKKLMHSVLEGDKDVIDDGKLIKDAINQGLSSFTPDMMMEQFVSNYKMAKQLYGERLIRELSGYDPRYVEKNIKIPEFQRELKKQINKNLKDMQKSGFIDRNFTITDKGVDVASLVLYMEELDKMQAEGFFGEKMHEKQSLYGGKLDERAYKKGDRYKDISPRKSIKTAVRREHKELQIDDLRVYTKQAKGKCFIIYALDSSGSMKGKKIDTCKKAGVALAFKAIEEKDEVGLIIFGDKIIRALDPSQDFKMILQGITNTKASKETNIAIAIERAIEMFPDRDVTRHLILLSDAMPTAGEDPAKATVEAVEKASAAGITISLIGIQLDKKGKKLAEQITAIGNGKLYHVSELEELDRLVLMDYYAVG